MIIQDLLEISILLSFLLVAIYLTAVDIKEKRIPNKVILPLIIYILIATISIQILDNELRWLIAGLGIPLLVFLCFFGIYCIYPKGLGMGDIKAMFLIGLVLCQENPALFFYSLTCSFLLGSVFALIFRISGNKTQEFAFGPFLFIPASLVVIFTQFS